MTVDVKNEKGLLVPEEIYLTSGIQIGTTQKSSTMKKFIYKVRNDGLYILDISKSDERIRQAAKFLSKYEPKDIMVVSSRIYGKKPSTIFAKNVGCKIIKERYVPGTLTNPALGERFVEPKVIFLTDPSADVQVLREAVSTGIPIVAICDSNNDTKYVDFVIPANNKGRRSLAVVYWLLTRELLKAKKKIASDDEYNLEIEDFEASL